MEVVLPAAALVIIWGSVVLAQWLVGPSASNRTVKVALTAIIFSLEGLAILAIAGIALYIWMLYSLTGLPRC